MKLVASGALGISKRPPGLHSHSRHVRTIGSHLVWYSTPVREETAARESDIWPGTR